MGRGVEKGSRVAGPTRRSWWRYAEHAAGASGDPKQVSPASATAGCAPFPRRRRQQLCRPRPPLWGPEPVPPRGEQSGHKPHVATLKGGTCEVGNGEAIARRVGRLFPSPSARDPSGPTLHVAPSATGLIHGCSFSALGLLLPSLSLSLREAEGRRVASGLGLPGQGRPSIM